jgi:Na+:H+ antiporter, NhaA family
MASPPNKPSRPRTWRNTVPRLSLFVIEHLIVLPLGAAIALVWVDTRPESYYAFTYPLAFVVNDIGMVFFFAIVAKEVVEATAPDGVLHHWRRVALPAIAALGATIVPVLIYLVFVQMVDEPMLQLAWPVPMAMDIALAYLVARLIFAQHPVIPFVLLLTLTANALGFAVLAVFFPTRDQHLGLGAVLMAAALVVAALLRSARTRSFWPYILIGGGLSWFALFWAGVHPAFALLPIMPFLPHAPRDPGFFVDAPPNARDALNRFELWAKYPAQVALFFFGLVNAGVPLFGLELGALAVPAAALIGRPIGVLLAIGLGVAAGFHLHPRVGWRELVVVGFITAAGFTVALFFATAVLAPGILLRETKMGVLLSLVGVGLAFLFAWLLRAGRFAR